MRARSRETEKLFSVHDLIIAEFNQVLQMEMVSLKYGDALHVIDVETSIKNGGVINKSDAVSTWTNKRKFFLMNIYAGGHGYIHTDRGQILNPSNL